MIPADELIWADRQELIDEVKQLREALGVLYADCCDYIKINNLYRSDGKSAIWNQSMTQAADALGIANQ